MLNVDDLPKEQQALIASADAGIVPGISLVTFFFLLSLSISFNSATS